MKAIHNDIFGAQYAGFGCAYITGGLEKSQGIKLLRAAFDSGVRHFDTAPLYGRGTSEDVIGEAFQSDRNKISITTKVGLPRPKATKGGEFVRAIALPIRRYLPKVSRGLASAIYGRKDRPKKFSPHEVLAGLDDSLTRLKTDYVDVLLLHEATAEDITPELLEVLSLLKAEGRVLRTGIGSEATAIAEIDRRFPAAFDVYQRSWSIFTRNVVQYQTKKNVFHRCIMNNLERLQNEIKSSPPLARHIWNVTGMETIDREELAMLLIGAAISANPSGLILFGTRQKARIHRYAEAAFSPSNIRSGADLLDAYHSYFVDQQSAESLS